MTRRRLDSLGFSGVEDIDYFHAQHIGQAATFGANPQARCYLTGVQSLASPPRHFLSLMRIRREDPCELISDIIKIDRSFFTEPCWEILQPKCHPSLFLRGPGQLLHHTALRATDGSVSSQTDHIVEEEELEVGVVLIGIKDGQLWIGVATKPLTLQRR